MFLRLISIHLPPLASELGSAAERGCSQSWTRLYGDQHQPVPGPSALTRAALSWSSAGLGPALTTAMQLFVQSTCPELNTDSDRGEMAASF